MMGVNCCQMHSDLTQQERDEVMLQFKTGKKDVLVATDIVARGIDIDDIQMVINYDVPRDCEDYVHRIGRTARADRDGEAITLVNEADMYAFGQIEKFIEKTVEKIPLPEELGEGPEYTPERHGSPRGKGRGRGRKGKYGGKRRNNKRGNNSKRDSNGKKKVSGKKEKNKE